MANEPMARDADLDDDEGLSLLDIVIPLLEQRRLLMLVPLGVGLIALAITYAITPVFTARTTFLPPQQQSGASAALASLGALSSLAGGITNIKNPADQYVALMQSNTVSYRIIGQFNLMRVYDVKYRFQARKTLEQNVHITVGKKDGLIYVDVDDVDPKRAADIANRHVEELRRMTNELALTEAQQRRVFFGEELKKTQARLSKAQQALQASGFNPGALKTEPAAAAEAYARLHAEVTAAEVQLQTLRRNLADAAPDVQQQLTRLNALREQLAKTEASTANGGNADYVSKYREFKYQETLFDLFSRQYELARLDESREGALIQVVDPATPPEWKSRPKRAVIAIVAMLTTLLVLATFVVIRHSLRQSASDPRRAEKFTRLRSAFRDN